MFRKHLNKKTPEEPKPTMNLNALEEHLDSIKVRLLEVRAFRKKKIVKSPTHHFMQNIDIEEAWPSCRKPFFQTFDLLCSLAQNLRVEYEAIPSTAPFGRAIDQFVNLIDRIAIFLETTDDSAFSAMNLKTIDSIILSVQQATNLLQKHVLVDFSFTRSLKD